MLNFVMKNQKGSATRGPVSPSFRRLDRSSQKFKTYMGAFQGGYDRLNRSSCLVDSASADPERKIATVVVSTIGLLTTKYRMPLTNTSLPWRRDDLAQRKCYSKRGNGRLRFLDPRSSFMPC